MKVFSTDKYDTVSHKCCLLGVNMYEVSLTVSADFYYKFCTKIKLPSNNFEMVVWRWLNWFYHIKLDIWHVKTPFKRISGKSPKTCRLKGIINKLIIWIFMYFKILLTLDLLFYTWWLCSVWDWQIDFNITLLLLGKWTL